MKLISWNINGLRAVLRKGLLGFVEKEKPDVLCLQEIKIGKEPLAQLKPSFPGYSAFWHSAQRPGYSGTAVLLKDETKDQFGFKGEVKDLGEEVFDSEGRVQILEFKDFFLFNCYYPNSNPELSRLDYKLAFNQAILAKAKKLEKKKPVIVTGDFNVAHQEIDLARPKENTTSPGFTPEERESMTKFLGAGFIDSFRHLHKDKVKYSWWSYRSAARARNIGWRIDYFCLSAKLKPKISQADILDKVLGSDHAPVYLELKKKK